MILILIIVIGCSYSVYSSSYPHLKTVNIQSFENKTTEYDLEENILNQITNLFQDDGRLKIVDLNPDCTLEGTILDYSDKISDFSDAGIDEYEVKILLNLKFIDLKKNDIIWENSALILSETYSSSDELNEYKTETEAQEKIIEDLFDTIMKETMEEW